MQPDVTPQIIGSPLYGTPCFMYKTDINDNRPGIQPGRLSFISGSFLIHNCHAVYFTSLISFASVSKNAGFSPTVMLAIFPSGLTITFVGKPWTA